MMKTRTNEQVVNEHVSNEAKPQRDAAGAAGPESRPPEGGTPNSKVLVVYHRADFDGLFCREIARRFLGEGAEYVGWDYGDVKIPWPTGRMVYVLDLSPECLEGMPEHVAQLSNLIWIDHHKSAMEKFSSSIGGYRIDGVAACRLAWQYFQTVSGLNAPAGAAEMKLPVKEDFVDRRVSEPEAVRLAGEYDVWDKRDPDAEVFQFGLRSKELTEEDWEALLGCTARFGAASNLSDTIVPSMLRDGKMLQRYQQEQDAGVVKYRSYLVEFEGLKFLALNTARCNSLTFAAKDVPETGHDGLLGFYFDGKQWKVSLYHARHRTDLDLSVIAVKYGGGGHRGACGFVTESLPFVRDEMHEMQLAAIMTASMQNTAATVKDRISRENPYWTQAYEDVCKAVDREMEWREKADVAVHYADWLAEVQRIARLMKMEEAAVAAMADQDWKVYFGDGLSPAEAFGEEFSRGE